MAPDTATATSLPPARIRSAHVQQTPDSPRRARPRKQLRNWLLFAVLAGPNIALLVVFTYRPLLQSFYLSTLQWNLGSPTAIPVGLANYADWFSDPGTPRTLAVTAVFTLATVGGGMVLGLLLAVLLNRKLRFRGAARTIVVALLHGGGAGEAAHRLLCQVKLAHDGLDALALPA